MSLGFAQAGVKPLLAADVDEDACATYAANLGNAVRCLDLSRPGALFERELSRYAGAFAIIGGPPCQGFSSAGLKSASDQRNQLIFSYLNMVAHVRPRWFLFENVEGLLTSNNGQSVTDLVKNFIALGYCVRLEKVNFASYGLPQARKRVLLVGNSLGLDFQLPQPTHSYDAGKHRTVSHLPFAPTLDEALSGLGAVREDTCELAPYRGEPTHAYDRAMREGNQAGGTDLHYADALSPHVQAIVAHLKQGQTMKDVPESLWHESFRRRAFRRVKDGTPTERRGGAPSGVKRLVGKLNSLTITSAATTEFIHPHENRPLSLREAARLQSFPDHYRFSGGSLSIAQQIGNAFPPLAARTIAAHLLELDIRASKSPQRSSFGKAGALLDFHLTDALGMSPALAKTNAMLTELKNEQLSMAFHSPLFQNQA
jgi:DNA (cytosine-5)-methyltransferase 1